MAREQPEIFVLSGPNGAGKTTVAQRLLPETLGVQNFVNADYVAQGLSPHSPETSAFDAGRLMLQRLHELRAQGATFAFETTLASRSFAPFLRDAKRQGYLVHLIFVFLNNADLAVHRVRQRVERGGHHVPEDTIRRRFKRGLANFFELYQPLADTWSVCDNSAEGLARVAHGHTGKEPTVVDAGLWERVLDLGAADGR